MVKETALAGIVLTLVFLSIAATAHTITKQECAEGGDFIRNAALSRENGMDGTTFITKMLADVALIRSFPVELRWFVQDVQDEDFLVKAATDVFEHPKAPEEHQRSFIGACMSGSYSSP